MSTEKRIHASQENGKKGGPKTADGKLRSSQNARKLDLYARRQPTLSTEDRLLFEELRTRYFIEYQPIGTTEVDLVEQLTMTTWRIRRYAPVAQALLECEMSNQAAHLAEWWPAIDCLMRTSLAVKGVLENSAALRDLERIENRLYRQQERLIRLLHDLRRDRKTQAVQESKKCENVPRSAEPATPAPAAPQRETAYINPDNWSLGVWSPVAAPDVFSKPQKRLVAAQETPPLKVMVA